MGAGIAQLAARPGRGRCCTTPTRDALERGSRRAGRARWAQKGRASDAAAAAARLVTTSALAPCDLVIEAAPESLELKRELFARLAEVAPRRCVLASNTSSIPVTEIAPRPGARAGRRDALLQPRAGDAAGRGDRGRASGEAALAVARATGEAMGKRVIDAADGPASSSTAATGPFGLEALRLLQERLADVETIDRICRLGGGFRMGPFELSDLVGVDVGFEVSKSFYELSFGEPRWRPSPLARDGRRGRLGRKTGRGWYEYEDGRHRPADPDPPGRRRRRASSWSPAS